MPPIALEFHGSRTGPDGCATDHLATVLEPEENCEKRSWFCRICCPTLFQNDEIIIGATAAQALHLAKLFVLDALDRHGVTVKAEDREQ